MYGGEPPRTAVNETKTEPTSRLPRLGRRIPAGHHRTRTRSTPDRIHAGQGLFPQVVAGDGFEPS